MTIQIIRHCLIAVLIISATTNVQSKSQLATNNQSCHPVIKPHLDQYIIGYGSLIESASKNETYHGTGPSMPIMLSGFKRGWIAQGMDENVKCTFLGIVQDPKSKLNGVIFKVPTASAIHQYDQREDIYCRVQVAHDQIQMLSHTSLPVGQYWVYLTKPTAIAKPSPRFPITQSYVDIYLSGCFEMQKKFHLNHYVTECIDATSGWSPHWVNDRIYPNKSKITKKIDELLAHKIPRIYNAIKTK